MSYHDANLKVNMSTGAGNTQNLILHLDPHFPCVLRPLTAEIWGQYDVIMTYMIQYCSFNLGKPNLPLYGRILVRNN